MKLIPIEKLDIEKLKFKGFYPVRASNKITELKKWNKWAQKYYGKQKSYLVDELGFKLKKEHPESKYWKMRLKGGLEERYSIWSK